MGQGVIGGLGMQQELFILGRVTAILLLTYVVARLFDTVIERRFVETAESLEVRKTSRKLLKRLLEAGIYVIGIGAAFYAIPGFRQIAIAIFASAGFIGIVVGFAAQEAFSNIISGIFIAIFQPFRVGDTVETQGDYGTVEDITLRQTVIQTPSNERVILPNTRIMNEKIINYSIKEEKSRYSVTFSIAYEEDIDEAKSIILQAADEHDLTTKGESEVIVKDLADSGVVLELRIWAEDRSEAWRAGQDLRETIKERFDEEGITIPFPQRRLSGAVTTGDIQDG